MSVSTAPASSSGLYADPREDWLAQHTEEIIDPARPIVDPHHHLWDRGGLRYMIEELAQDIASGHNIVATVYVEARSMYRSGGPEELRPVGDRVVVMRPGFLLRSSCAHLVLLPEPAACTAAAAGVKRVERPRPAAGRVAPRRSR